MLLCEVVSEVVYTLENDLGEVETSRFFVANIYKLKANL